MRSHVETERLLLRPPVAADAAACLAVFGDLEANAHNPRGACRTLVEAAAAIDSYSKNWQTHGFDVWAVRLKEAPDEVIGFGGLGVRTFEAGPRINLGYGLHRSVWGRGLAKELALASIAVARQQGEPAVIWARVQAENLPSRRVLEAVGMTLADGPAGVGELLYSLSTG